MDANFDYILWSSECTWGLPYGEQILATLTGLNAALGAVVKYYKSRYDKESEE